MALKKSDLYSTLWQSCDQLRGGMDASQYKDYVLFMLFIKYISDKYADSDVFAPPLVIPEGSSFSDMLELRGKAILATESTNMSSPRLSQQMTIWVLPIFLTSTIQTNLVRGKKWWIG